jgi:hypothetical protein
MNALASKISRLSGGPLAVRGVLFLAAWVALLVAGPAEIMQPRFLLAAGLIAALPAVMPHTGLVTMAMLAAIGGWLIDTVAFGTPATALRLLTLSLLLYFVHAAAALAAVLPYDAVVERQVITRWAGRGMLVALSAGVFTVALLLLLPGLPSLPPAAPVLAGLLAAVGVLALLVRLVRR